jgi:prolyl-tRNA synthetase
MKFDRALIPTLREEPKDAETKSHKLLIRGGFMKPFTAGVFIYLPLGWRVMMKIGQIIREEMDRIGGQELLLPVMAPREIWEEAGRWEAYGDDMFRLKDRKGRDYCLCPTHEEVIADIARGKIRSYRDLPQIWYQIQTKFRDEPRPRFGVIRTRQFTMKDSYSLDSDETGLDQSFNRHHEAYTRIFKRCGLDFVSVSASGGIMGTGESREFMALVEGGEDEIIKCVQCDYRSNLEIAEGKGEYISFADGPVEKVATPERRTVEEVTQFLRVTPQNLAKNMYYTAPGKPGVLILVRGDYEINEDRLKRKIGADYQPASAEEILRQFGAEPGFIGPVGLEGIAIYADELLKDTRGMITGANLNHYHIKGLNLTRDVKVKEFLNLRRVKAGDQCPRCGKELQIHSALELGHIFKLGTKYSVAMGALFLDEAGTEKPIIMGSYGIGLERIMACALEQKGDEKGAVWPISIAPYDAQIVVLNPDDPEIARTAETISRDLEATGISHIIDDRDVSAGIKFNDADLVGLPIKVTIGKKGLSEGKFDITRRDTGEVFTAARDSVAGQCRELKEILFRGINAGL